MRRLYEVISKNRHNMGMPRNTHKKSLSGGGICHSNKSDNMNGKLWHEYVYIYIIPA